MRYVNKLIALADMIIPEWRSKRKHPKNAFARKLLIKSLRDNGMTLIEIGAVMDRSHPAIILSLKWLNEAVLTQIEMETKELWEAEVKKLREG